MLISHIVENLYQKQNTTQYKIRVNLKLTEY
ncbi:hypothetical protein FHS70_004817 [Flammeovirga yaeyamensis]|nr:hypothetical protein [Flammeovirga yaeyamensis]